MTGIVAPRASSITLRVGKGADHDAVQITRQRLRRIRDRLAAADLQIVAAQEQRVAAQLIHADFEGNPRARGRFSRKSCRASCP